VGGGREIVAAVNPYSSFDLLTFERAVGCAPLTVTPVRSGVFASDSREPGQRAAAAAAAETLAGHPTGGLVTIFDYPAGTALLGIAGARGLVLLSVLALLLAGGAAVGGAEPPHAVPSPSPSVRRPACWRWSGSPTPTPPWPRCS